MEGLGDLSGLVFTHSAPLPRCATLLFSGSIVAVPQLWGDNRQWWKAELAVTPNERVEGNEGRYSERLW